MGETVSSKPDSHGPVKDAAQGVRAGTAVQRMVDVVLGTHPSLRSRVMLGLLPVVLYVVWIVTHLFSVHMGYMSADAAKFAIGHHIIGILVFYLLVRSGYSARFQDSGLIQAQIMWAASVAIFIYSVNAPLRVAIMQLLCMIHLFGLFTLRPRQLLFTGGSTILMLLVMLAVMLHLKPANFIVDQEIFKILFACFIIGLLTWMSILHSLARGNLSKKKKELAQAVAQVNELVTRDALTGLYNRKHMQELLERERIRQAHTGQPFCVALIDLDHFKHVNDSYGHQVGDEVLCSFAKTAELTLRETDTIARWGGEEFLVLMPETTLEPYAQVAIDRMRNMVRELAPSATVPTLRFSFSAGLAAHIDGHTADQSIARADHALYAAKHAGRNCTMLATAANNPDSACAA